MSLLPSGSKLSLALTVNEQSQIAEARRRAVAVAATVGFPATESGKVALIVTEAASNLVKHGGGGEIVINIVEHGSIKGLEVLALDRGPGMADLARCMRDGYSTSGTPGTGLGAITRLSSEFDIHSVPDTGTAVLTRVWSQSLPRGMPSSAKIGAIRLPKPGEHECGDQFAIQQSEGRLAVLIADGLGHGPIAAVASQEAARVFQENVEEVPEQILQLIHDALRSTRGAAVLVAEVDCAARQVRCAGVGNLCGVIITSDNSRNLVSHNGTLGHSLYKVQQFTYPFPHNATLILHSDGLATSWRLDKYAGLAARDPALIAGVLYRDFKRGRDDLAVVVIRDV